MKFSKNLYPLPIERESYLELVDCTGRAIKAGKSGTIPAHLTPILTRLQIDPAHWISTVSSYKYAFGKVVGSIVKLDDWREKQNEVEESSTKWLKGNKGARKFYL